MLLADTDTIYIPHVYTWGEYEGKVYLVTEYVYQAPHTREFQRSLGERIAHLHSYSESQFGLDWDNYIGSLPQSNTWHTQWSDFFITERLRPQVQRGFDIGYLTKTEVDQFETLYQKIEEIFPQERPALIHGDLWSGNVLATYEGTPALIDPAVYYGHREIELAFTQLFGGFSDEFYSGYESVLRIPDGFEERIPVYNLYPQLVHLNLFEGMFYTTIKETMQRYT
ncbi:MAG: fructosamine kinase family protein, partial [Candidatus Paceibacteria bacterium]